MDLALLIFLVLLNGAFAMSEISLAPSRKARPQMMAGTGDTGPDADRLGAGHKPLNFCMGRRAPVRKALCRRQEGPQR